MKQERTPLEVSFPKHLNFAMDHAKTCGRPRMFRAYMFYAPWVVWAPRWLVGSFPRLFGGTIVGCDTCKEMVHVSGGWMFNLVSFFRWLFFSKDEYVDQVVIVDTDYSNLKESEESCCKL